MGRKFNHRPPAQSRGIHTKGPKMNANGRGIIQPNAMNIEATFSPGPLAQPAVITLQQPGALKVLTIGGLTKVEQLAGQIAIGMKPKVVYSVDTAQDVLVYTDAAAQAVDMAEAILAECEKRRAPPAEAGA